MDPLALTLHAAGSSKPAGASADGAVQQAPAPAVAVESRSPNEIRIPVAEARSLVISNPEVPNSSQVLGKEIIHVGGSSSSSGDGHGKGKAVVDAEAAGTIQTAEVVDDRRFVLIPDVKAMLQTGRFEGEEIIYKNKRRKLSLLHGVIRGTYYFCTCGDDCGHNGKALSARAFEQHAVMKGGKESNNPNDHIILSSSNVSMFEACRILKEARSEATLQAKINTIVKSDHEAMRKENVKAPADNVNLMDVVHNLENRMERNEKMMENLQSQVNTMEKSIDFLCKEMQRHQGLFADLSKIMRKFVDDM